MRARFNKAEILREKGEFANAARMYMMVAILYDDNRYVPKSLRKAGESFSKAGMRKESIKAYNDFLKRFPGHSEADEVKNSLKGIENEAG